MGPYVFSSGSKQDIFRVDKEQWCHKSQGEERACFQKAAKAKEASAVKNIQKACKRKTFQTVPPASDRNSRRT